MRAETLCREAARALAQGRVGTDKHGVMAVSYLSVCLSIYLPYYVRTYLSIYRYLSIEISMQFIQILLSISNSNPLLNCVHS